MSYTVSDQRISEVAGATADAIIKRGHCKNLLMNRTMQVCALGALGVAVSDSPHFLHSRYAFSNDVPQVQEFNVVHEIAANRVQRLIEDTLMTVVYMPTLASWNNATERTADEVIALFREIEADYAYRTYADNLSYVGTQDQHALAAGSVA